MGRKLERTRQQLKVLGREWLRATKTSVSGPVLRRRTSRLWRSLELVDRTDEDPPTIEVTTDAKSDKGFPYAAYHEFESGLSFIRPSLLFVMSKQFRGRQPIQRAMVQDAAEGMIEQLLERGWFPGRLPISAFRTVRMDMMGGVARGTTQQRSIPIR